MKSLITKEFKESIKVKEEMLSLCTDDLEDMARSIFAAMKKGNKLLVFGNGGSAADAQHIAGELIGRFLMDRKALPCIALTTDTSIITAVGNDYSFSEIFARQIEGLGESNDVVLAISTSGESPNVIKGIKMARKKGCLVLAFGGKKGGEMKNLAHKCLVVPSHSSQRIQECHILLAHTLCLLIEELIRKDDGV